MRLIAVLVVSTILISCKDETEFQVQTTSATWDGTTAEVSGRIKNTESKVIEFGICYSLETQEPIIESDKAIFYGHLKTQKFSLSIPNLQADTAYYVRAYAITKNRRIGYGKPIRLQTY